MAREAAPVDGQPEPYGGGRPRVERRQRQLGAVQCGAGPANGTGGPQVPRGGAGGSGGRAAFRLE